MENKTTTCTHCKNKGCNKCVGGCMECDKQMNETITFNMFNRKNTKQILDGLQKDTWKSKLSDPKTILKAAQLANKEQKEIMKDTIEELIDKSDLWSGLWECHTSEELSKIRISIIELLRQALPAPHKEIEEMKKQTLEMLREYKCGKHKKLIKFLEQSSHDCDTMDSISAILILERAGKL